MVAMLELGGDGVDEVVWPERDEFGFLGNAYQSGEKVDDVLDVGCWMLVRVGVGVGDSL